MGVKCQIKIQGNSIAVEDKLGNPSKLYQSLLNAGFPVDRALSLWSLQHTQDFKDIFGYKEDVEPSLKDILVYNEEIGYENGTLSGEEIAQLSNIISKTGLGNLSTLLSTLRRAFKTNDVTLIEPRKILASGLYRQQNIKTLTVEEVNNFISKIEGFLKTTEDVTVASEFVKGDQLYRDPSRQTVIGTDYLLNEEDVAKELYDSIDNFQDADEIITKVQELPYNEFVYRFNNDNKFSKKIISRATEFKRIPSVTLTDGKLSVEQTSTLTTIRNTIEAGHNTNEVEAYYRSIFSLSPEVYSTDFKGVTSILKKAEKSFLDLGLDVIGISEKSELREEVKVVFDSAINLLKNPNEVNQNTFARSFDNLTGVNKKSVVRRLEESIRPYTIVQVNNKVSDEENFTANGLIRVGENLYHKVDTNTSVDNLYEVLYKRISDGTLSINTVKDVSNPNNKQRILRDLKIFINLRDTGLNLENNSEKVSLFQVVFKHPSLTKQDTNMAIDRVSAISPERQDFLKTKFVSEFYHYMIRQKFFNSEIYNQTLKKFEITDEDISLKDADVNLDILPKDIKRNLLQYLYLKKGVEFNMIFNEATNTNVKSEQLRAINFPDSFSEFKNSVIKDGEYVITESNNFDFIKYAGKMYQKTDTKNGKSIYAPLKINTDGTYKNISQQDIRSTIYTRNVLSHYAASKIKLDSKAFEDMLKSGGFNDPVTLRLKMASIKRYNTFQERINELSRITGESVVSDGSVIVKYTTNKSRLASKNRALKIKEKVDEYLLERIGNSFSEGLVTVNNTGTSYIISPSQEMRSLAQNNREVQRINKGLEEGLLQTVIEGMNEEIVDNSRLSLNDKETNLNQAQSIVDSNIKCVPLPQQNDILDRKGDCGG